MTTEEAKQLSIEINSFEHWSYLCSFESFTNAELDVARWLAHEWIANGRTPDVVLGKAPPPRQPSSYEEAERAVKFQQTIIDRVNREQQSRHPQFGARVKRLAEQALEAARQKLLDSSRG